MSGPYYSELIKGVQDTALKYGYDLIACSSVGGRESTGIKFLKEHRVDGAIVLSAYIPGNMLLETAREGFPIVVLDRIIHNSYLINVTVNNKQGGYKATEHLINLGHERIGFMGGPINTIDSRDRFSGYLEALNDYQLPFEDKWLMSGNFTRESGYEGTKELLESGVDLPTAMFYANDEMAIGGIKAFQEVDLKVPEDLSIIGFDDIDLAEFINPALTTVKLPKYEVGSLCSELLIKKLNGEQVESSTKLTTEVIVRGSTRSLL